MAWSENCRSGSAALRAIQRRIKIWIGACPQGPGRPDPRKVPRSLSAKADVPLRRSRSRLPRRKFGQRHLRALSQVHRARGLHQESPAPLVRSHGHDRDHVCLDGPARGNDHADILRVAREERLSGQSDAEPRAEMCGIAGFVGAGDLDVLRHMTDALRHRGPDGEGLWMDEDSRVFLGFRRLSIIDLEGGAQPMWTSLCTKCGRQQLGVVFNGEIYNHAELRAELKQRGHIFTTDHSDTEVLLHGYGEWGDTFVERLNGMWA